MVHDLHLVNVMNAVASSLSDPADVDETLTRITRTALESVPGAQYVSISVRHPDGRLDTVAETDPLVTRIDELQYELREGPSYDVVTDDEWIVSDDVRSEARWPVYGPRVGEMGIRSQLAMRLHLDSKSRVGLNMYSRQRDAFDDPQHVAELFSSHARIALGYAQRVTQLTEALATRTVIGEATGIVMERYSIPVDRAFEFLIRVSQTSNVKLREVAERLVALEHHPDDTQT
jgi:GAF domain-containing protein